MDVRALGTFGEKSAARFLRRNGYRIVDMNYSCRFGEIDIIASKDGFIVFVEVKLRKNADFAEAREFVSYSKQQRVLKTAQLWLSTKDCDLQPRFDVIEVYAPKGLLGSVTVNHIENAFM